MIRRFAPAAPVVAAVVLAGAAMWLAFDNPDVDGGTRSDSYTCLAPWDTVLNDADNLPGGEPPPDGEAIAARCRTAGEGRFNRSVVVGGTAVVCLVAAATAGRVRGRDRAASSESLQ